MTDKQTGVLKGVVAGLVITLVALGLAIARPPVAADAGRNATARLTRSDGTRWCWPVSRSI